MNLFSRISDIDLADETTWKGRIFITLDIDWAADFVLKEAIGLLEDAAIPATWFSTHETPLLERIRNNPLFELGVHPNFNPLLFSAPKATVPEVMEQILQHLPGCAAMRSHSLVQSSGILATYAYYGLRYDCNILIPWDAGMVLKPWRHWDGEVVRVPHLWEDDVACLYGWPMDTSVNYWYQAEGINVLDFHPIHLYLNSNTLTAYEASRMAHRDPIALAPFRQSGIGSRTFLESLISNKI